MKRDRTQQRLDQLRTVKNSPESAESRMILADALKDPSNYVAAKAADLIEQFRVPELVPSLLAAYDRHFGDRGCEATTALAKALYALDYQHPEPYLKGIRHRQMEGYGTQSDVASGLRGVCALALVLTNHPKTIDELTLLLTDEEAPARLSAARALGCTGQESVIPLLMFKVYTGDDEMEVLAECMASMLAVSIPRSLEFAIQQLDSSNAARSEASALALGSVRDERAFEALRQKWDSTAFGEIRERVLHAMAASRTDKAIEFLMGLVKDEPERTAALAVKALSIHRRDSRIISMIEEAGRLRLDLQAAIRSAFGPAMSL